MRLFPKSQVVGEFCRLITLAAILTTPTTWAQPGSSSVSADNSALEVQLPEDMAPACPGAEQEAQAEFPSRVSDYQSLAEKFANLPEEKWLEFVDNRYGHSARYYYQWLKKTAPAYRDLIFDPGLIFHFNDFQLFVIKLQSHRPVIPLPQNPWELRERFRQELGDESYFRSMALTEEELQAVLRHGILSPAVRTSQRENIGPVLESSLADQFRMQVDGRGRDREKNFISITKKNYVGNFVSSMYKEKGDGKKIYEFALRLPKIDVIYAKKRGILFADKAMSYPELESFILTGIAPQEIQFVTKRRSHKAARIGQGALTIASILWGLIQTKLAK